jgi:precorrin-8X/cobalt-precorrin-8 methylmutase
VREALARQAPILCDCRMVAAGLLARHLASPPVVTLNDPEVPELAKRTATTRSAAATTLWADRLGGAVVVIGNAPTALFRLLEGLAEGWPRPAAIIAAPVGFVGAAESKALLAESGHAIPFLTLLGRRGGSAIAAAGFNALAGGLS